MADTATEHKISRVAALHAVRDGGQACRDGKSVTDCPYSTAGALAERFLGHFWRKGYAAQLRLDQ